MLKNIFSLVFLTYVKKKGEDRMQKTYLTTSFTLFLPEQSFHILFRKIILHVFM